jgi:hypothetical protein
MKKNILFSMLSAACITNAMNLESVPQDVLANLLANIDSQFCSMYFMVKNKNEQNDNILDFFRNS